MGNSMTEFHDKFLEELAIIEQNIVTRTLIDGTEYKTAYEDVMSILEDHKISKSNKLRLAILYYLSEYSSKDIEKFKTMIKYIGEYEDKLAPLFENTLVLNAGKIRNHIIESCRKKIDYQNHYLLIGKAKNLLNKFGFGGNTGADELETLYSKEWNSEYELSRNINVLPFVVSAMSKGILDISIFPYIKDTEVDLELMLKKKLSLPKKITRVDRNDIQTKLQKTKLYNYVPTWHKGCTQDPDFEDLVPVTTNKYGLFEKQQRKPKIIVFILGGLTYSEMRDAELLSKHMNTDIYIGSTHIITPKSVLKSLNLE
ncbi:hypothetical protein BB560_002912 [Smittium megazygosporum]|uniref:Uncharacterized protein n=1 Tax=Smittium megazygosporum TaxID=133381 RepID=A0A2T9ZDH0_9FUNG|nr:hypothetical protein BB560_002912 [Smittium megazygosporum]